MSGKNLMDHEFKIQTAKATPAVAGAVFSGVTLNETVAIVTIIYVLLQIGYLIWKWRRESSQ